MNKKKIAHHSYLVDRFRVNGYSKIEREKLNSINSIYTPLEQFKNYKNKTTHFEEQRRINQVQQSSE